MYSKKGMSPLIATVLLIAFAVALGAMIMNWSTDLEVAPAADGNPCDNINIELNQVFGKEIFCYADDNIRFNVINAGTKPIDGIQVRTVDDQLKEVKEDLPSSSISVGESFEQELAFDKSGKVHVELVPMIRVDNQPQYCVQKRIVQDILPDCSS